MLRFIENCATCDANSVGGLLTSNGVNCIVCEAKLLAEQLEPKYIDTEEKESGFMYLSIWTRKIKRFKVFNEILQKFGIDNVKIVNLQSGTKSCNDKDYHVAEIKIPICTDDTETYRNNLIAIETVCKSMHILSWGIKTTQEYKSVYAKYVIDFDNTFEKDDFLKALFFMYERFKSPILKLTRFYAIPNSFANTRDYAKYSPYGKYAISNQDIPNYVNSNYTDIADKLLSEKKNIDDNNGLIEIVDNKIILNIGRPTLHYKSLIGLMGLGHTLVKVAYDLSKEKEEHRLILVSNVPFFYELLKSQLTDCTTQYFEHILSMRRINEMPSYDEHSSSNSSGSYTGQPSISSEHRRIVNKHDDLFSNDNDDDD